MSWAELPGAQGRTLGVTGSDTSLLTQQLELCYKSLCGKDSLHTLGSSKPGFLGQSKPREKMEGEECVLL